jgi:membrane-associated HD superfamily phosphohydrolase
MQLNTDLTREQLLLFMLGIIMIGSAFEARFNWLTMMFNAGAVLVIGLVFAVIIERLRIAPTGKLNVPWRQIGLAVVFLVIAYIGWNLISVALPVLLVYWAPYLLPYRDEILLLAVLLGMALVITGVNGLYELLKTKKE